MSKIFDGVAGNHPALNRFDLSYTNTTSMSIGYLYPLQCDEVYPGSVWKMSAFCHAEIMPLIAPLMSDLQLFCHVFFVPFRLLYGVDSEDGQPIWEKFITGGKDGDYDTPLPTWIPSFSEANFSSKKIWDYIGNPMSYDSDSGVWSAKSPDPDVLGVSIAPKRAYNFIVNKYYIDENLQDELDLDQESLFKVSFRKDYFTSALEAQQRGTAPALPVDITGNVPVLFTNNVGSNDNFRWPSIFEGASYANIVPRVSNPSYGLRFAFSDIPNESAEYGSAGIPFISGSVDLSSSVSATTFTPSDLRLAFAIQRMQELAMRSGYRYTEWLSANFNAHPTDARLDRPEYIGGCIMPVSISPLVQTSETSDTPQGNKSGIGHIDAINKIGNYRVLEHGLIMTMVSIRPKPIYQQGIDRQWLRQTRFDYYNPALAYLSEQGIYNAEIFVDGLPAVATEDTEASEDKVIFGYQAHWNEMRAKQNRITGAVREQFEYYALGRKFENRPHLNSDFIQIKDTDFNHVWAVQNEDQFVVSWSSIIDAYLPIPQMGVPGLIDHVYGGY